MRVAELHRFPVKSMGGERLRSADIDHRALAGDRLWAVWTDVDRIPKMASGKHSRRFTRLDPVFSCVAATTDNGVQVRLPDGSRHLAGAPATDTALSEHFDRPVRLQREGSVSHMDAASVSIVGTATLYAAAQLAGANPSPLDSRRFRANLVVETDEPWVEESWLGATVRIGQVRLLVTERIVRCRMVDIAQVDVVERRGLLRTLSTVRELCLAVYADPLTGGTVAVGDVVTVS